MRELRLGSSPGPELQSGRSYWLITRDPMVLRAAGTSTPTDSAFAVVLEPGWNMVGSEFFFPVSWDSVKIATVPCLRPSKRVGSVFRGSTLPELAGESVSLSVLGSLSAKRFGPQPGAEGSAHSPEFPATDKTETRGAPFVKESGWSTRLSAESDDSREASARLGWSAGAREGWDPADQMIPPDPPGGTFRVCFPHPEWGEHAGRYLVDSARRGGTGTPSNAAAGSRSPGWGHSWDIEITAAGSAAAGTIDARSVSLRLESLATLPRDFATVLLDWTLGRSVRLQADSPYRFALTARPAGEGDRAPTVSAADRGGNLPRDAARRRLVPPPVTARLYPARPNPVSSAAVLRYDVAVGGRVDLAVFSVNGRTVRVLNHGWMLPGRYEALWDGRSEDGRRAVAGVYFVRLCVSGGERYAQRITVVE